MKVAHQTGSGDNGNAGKGLDGGISTDNQGEAGAGSRGGSQALDGVRSEGSGAEAAMAPVICRLQTVKMAVKGFVDTREVLAPDHDEEETLPKNLLSRMLRMIKERGKELHARRDALRQHVLTWVKGAETLFCLASPQAGR